MRRARFSWAWDGQVDRPDPLMTRERAARMLRAWRNDRGITLTARRAGRIRAYHAKHGSTGALMVIDGGPQ